MWRDRGRRREGLAEADGFQEEDVSVAIEEAKAEEVGNAVAVEGDGVRSSLSPRRHGTHRSRCGRGGRPHR